MNELELEFKNKSKGTILSIANCASAIGGFLLLLTIFLPIYKIEVLGSRQTFGLFTNTIGESGYIGIAIVSRYLFLCLSSMVGLLVIRFLSNRAINNILEKEKTSKIFAWVSLATIFLFTLSAIIFADIDFLAEEQEISTNFVSIASGGVILLIASIINVACTICNAYILSGIHTGKIKFEDIKLANLFNVPKAKQDTTAPSDVLTELKELKEMLDKGIITQEEFDAKKKQLLGL